MPPPFPVPSQEEGTFHGCPYKCASLEKQFPGDLPDTLQGEELGKSHCQVNAMDHKKNNMELRYSTKKRAGLFLSSAKDLMMFKELFKCPLAASTAGKPVSLVRQSSMC